LACPVRLSAPAVSDCRHRLAPPDQCSASVAAVRKRFGEPLRMDDFFITSSDFSAENDE